MNYQVSDKTDCEHVRPLLGSFVRGELAAEPRGRVEAHLDLCDDCADAFAQRITDSIFEGEIPEAPGVPRDIQVSEPMRTCRLVMCRPGRIPRSQLRSRGFREFLHSNRLKRGIPMAKEQRSVRLQVVDSPLDMAPDEVIQASVIGMPSFSTDGTFRMTLWLDKQELVDRFRGYTAICALQLEDALFAFESPVERQEISFTISGLPELDSRSVVELSQDSFQYFLIPPSPSSSHR